MLFPTVKFVTSYYFSEIVTFSVYLYFVRLIVHEYFRGY